MSTTISAGTKLVPSEEAVVIVRCGGQLGLRRGRKMELPVEGQSKYEGVTKHTDTHPKTRLFVLFFSFQGYGPD